MTDIVERLRSLGTEESLRWSLIGLGSEAADIIEWLRGLRAVDASVIRHWEEADTKSALEIERLKAALQEIAAQELSYDYAGEWASIEIARRALEPKP